MQDPESNQNGLTRNRQSAGCFAIAAAPLAVVRLRATRALCPCYTHPVLILLRKRRRTLRTFILLCIWSTSAWSRVVIIAIISIRWRWRITTARPSATSRPRQSAPDNRAHSQAAKTPIFSAITRPMPIDAFNISGHLEMIRTIPRV